MSLGFGFSLPALVPYGAGGNNPFNQSGPTLDLSFAGVVTDLSDPNGYTLNTNFITPQYQIAAQYVVWETGVGLVDKTFSQIITFSRASGATWFNSAGNLIGVDFSTSSNTIGTGSKTFTLDATAGVNRSWAAGDTVLISDQANSANNMTGTVTSYTASTQVLVVNVTSTGGSGTIASWRVGSTMPRLDYNPSTLAAQGLLIEEARTNLLTYSEQFDNAIWGPIAGTVTANATTAPSGAVTADRGVTSGVNFQVIQGATITSGATVSGSVFLKADGINEVELVLLSAGNITPYARATFNVLTGVISVAVSTANGGTNASASITAINNGWYRCVVTVTYPATTSAGMRINAQGATGGIFLWGAQLEAGAFPTSYIPTTTAALTRSADVASVNTLAPWYNQTEGTVYAELQSLSPLTAAQSVALGKYPNVWNIESGANDSVTFWYGIGAELILNGTYNNIGTVPSGINKFAVSLAASGGQSRSSLNGAVAVNRNGTLSGTATLFSLGKDSTNNINNFLNGYLRRLTYYPRALSAAELQAITA